jgi:hypothetical protein
MKSTDIIALIGAAAWLPQIATWIYRAFVNSVITIVPDQHAEVGFTSLGPIFNVRMAISADRKDAIIDGFELQLQHEDGESRVFRWVGLSETFSEITDNSGNRQVVSKDQVPIALKIGTESLIEKHVRFQEPRYHESIRPLVLNLIAHVNYLKRTGEGYVSKALESNEFFSVLDMRQKSFWRKAGKYTVVVLLSSPRKFSLSQSRFGFELSGMDADQLKQNLVTVEADLKDALQSEIPDFKPQPISWNWANVVLRKGEKDKELG